jgi:hypothetical protein
MTYLNKILVRQLFSEQYTLIIKSDLAAVNAVMQSITRLRWNIQFLSTTEEELEFRLILLEQELLEANNPLIKEVASLTSTFSKLYNELHIKSNHKGVISSILNAKAILSKWQIVKAELQEIANGTPEIKNIILLNDSIFQNEKNLIDTVQKSEFFLLYFNHIFDVVLPSKKTKIILPNFFNTANVDWTKNITAKQSPVENISDVHFETTPTLLQANYNELAYTQFKNNIDIKTLTPNLLETGNYTINTKLGKVLEAYIKRSETTNNELLFCKLEYHFFSDEIERDPSLKQNTKNTKLVNN